METITRYEDLSNNAWPALQVMQYDGWIIRFAGGVTKRSNSVSLLYPSTLDAEEKISFCESLYLSKHISPCFKITSAAQPAGIDKMLEARGYYIHSYISFQTLELAGKQIPPAPDVVIAHEPDPLWIDQFIRMNRFDASRKPVYAEIMNRITTRKCLVSVLDHGTTIAVGLGVLEGRYIGIFDLVVDPAYRNRGVANQVMNAILSWGQQAGAKTAYLQVLADNLPAIALYKKLEFTETYPYWYRMIDK